MKIKTLKTQSISISTKLALCLATVFLITGCYEKNDPRSEEPVVTPPPPPVSQVGDVLIGSDLNDLASPLLSLNSDGPGGSPNQSLRGGDVLQGGLLNDVLIGGLGVDVMTGGEGDDVLIGGTEDFNSSVDGDNRGSDNRDRAFGGDGDDTFIWAPGDGSDFFDGGEGTDVIIFGVVGEERNSDGSTEGAPFFNVNPPGSEGSQDFDGIFLDGEANHPRVRVSGSPGFCTTLDSSTNPDELSTLSLDHLIRFSLRGIADAFDAGGRTDDDGLRVAVSLRNTEFLVCTKRVVTDGGELNNVEVFDLTTSPATLAAISDLPEYVQSLIE